jgi:hypothetical protein
VYLRILTLYLSGLFYVLYLEANLTESFLYTVGANLAGCQMVANECGVASTVKRRGSSLSWFKLFLSPRIEIEPLHFNFKLKLKFKFKRYKLSVDSLGLT